VTKPTPAPETPPANRLATEASSYLRSAAHQPVDWHPWGPEAFEKARSEGKPILLDIGAVWCHWCHVMDGESYEDADTARLINEHFVPVKVDRDERPDVDARYQPAVAALTGGGGWPLTAFLTPDGEVFSGGTYFPPKDLYGRPGFPRVLQTVADAYRRTPTKLREQAREIQAAIERSRDAPSAKGAVSWGLVKRAFDAILMNFDFRHGGFGEAPKFPHASAVELALTEVAQAGDEPLTTVVEVTLTKMAQGGVADQLGGGFHRYSTDERWVVPHFEKMLYDNAQLLRNYCQAYQVLGIEYFKEVAQGTVAYMDRVLSDREGGGFYGSQDADVGVGDDGDFWTWTNAELEAALAPDKELYALMAAHYDITPHGEMHHNAAKNVLFVAETVDDLARRARISPKEAEARVAEGKRRMLEARERRAAPFVDKTVYTSWNGLAISAYVDAWCALGSDACLAFARKTADFLLEACHDRERGMAHQWLASTGPRVWGLLDDQAFFALALLDLHVATQEPRYLEAARSLADILLRDFRDEDGGLLDLSRPEAAGAVAKPLGSKVRPIQDTPTPSGNAVAAIAFDRLHATLGDGEYQEASARILSAFAASAPRYGLFTATLALAARQHLEPLPTVTVAGGRDDPRARALFEAAARAYPPGKPVFWVDAADGLPGGTPPSARDFVEGYPADRRPAACVCRGETCNLPTSDPAEVARQLAAAPEAAAAPPPPA